MTFLHPAALWGLLALSVPIIVHFFNFQRPKQVLFSNVAFVKEIQQTVVRRVRFQQWLLLLFRLLALAGLVLAFAGPLLRTSQTAAGTSRSVVIIVDNSYSMRAADDRSDYFYQATARARELIKAFGRQDELLLMTSSDLKLNFPFSNQAALLENMADMKAEQSLTSLEDILKAAPNLFSRASHPQRELFIISDFQTSTFLPDSARPDLGTDSLVRIRLIPVATRDQNNVFVSSHHITSRILEKGKPVSMSMQLVNDGKQAANGLNVRIMLGEKVAAISTTDVGPEGKRDLSVTFTPDSGGWHSGYVEIDDPDVDFDNRRYFSFYVPDAEKLLLVKGSPSPALDLLFETVSSQFDLTEISDRELSNADLGAYRSVILTGANALRQGVAERLKNFVNEGGSLLFAPGPEADLVSINALLRDLNLGTLGQPQTFTEGLPTSRAELAHPIFDGMFQANQTNRSIDPPRVFKIYPLSLAGGGIHQPILSLENGLPFLVEGKFGNGTVLVFTTPILGAWTDFQVKSLFAPLMYRSVQVMNQTQQVENNQEIGSFQRVAIRAGNEEIIRLISADQQDYLPEQFTRSGTTFLNFDQTDLPEGNYDLAQGNTTLQKISFNISDEESRLAYATGNEISVWLTDRRVENAEVLTETQEAISRLIETERDGTPLWKFFLIFALVFLAAEALLVGWSAKKSPEKIPVQR